MFNRMSFKDCINKNTELSKEEKTSLQEEYGEQLLAAKALNSDIDAELIATATFAQIKGNNLKRQKELAKKDLLFWHEQRKKIIKASEAIKAKKDKTHTGLKWIYPDSDVASALRLSLETAYTRTITNENNLQISMAQQLEAFRSKYGGITQDSKGFKDVVRVLIGGESKDAGATGDGKAIRATFDLAHKRFENAGGVIGRLDNYFPQSHNPKAVFSAGKQEWKTFITPKLNRDKMIDLETGLRMTDSKLDEIMDDVFDNISTNGLADVAKRAKEGKQSFGKGVSIAKRHSSARLLHFKDADSFFEYNNKFGFGDEGLFDAMIGHVHSMSRDTAIMEEFGPNPTGQLERLKMQVIADGAGPQTLRTIDGMYDVLAGRTSYNGKNPAMYDAVRGTQNVLRSAMLGTAAVSALGDGFYAVATAKANGLPVMGAMKTWFNGMNPANRSHRRMMRTHIMAAGAVGGRALQNARFADDMGSHGVTSWMASFTNRMGYLQGMTDAIRTAPIIETMGFMSEAKYQKLGWADLHPNMKDAFERWDMDEVDFNNIMKSKRFKDQDSGAELIRSDDVAMAGFADTARKYDMWMMDMSQSASNEPRLLTRAIATGAVFGDAREGTINRGLASSIMMFRSFGTTVVLNHMIPALRHAASGEGMSRLTIIPAYLFGTAVFGMMALQARQFVTGKEPKPFDEKLFAAGLAQGGGFGVYGDFLFSDFSRHDRTLQATLTGPLFGTLNDATHTFAGNFQKMMDEDQDSKFWADLYKLGESNVPMVNLWYTRLLIERGITDHIEKSLNPNYERKLRKREKQMKEDGQGYYWRPGDPTPFSN